MSQTDSRANFGNHSNRKNRRGNCLKMARFMHHATCMHKLKRLLIVIDGNALAICLLVVFSALYNDCALAAGEDVSEVGSPTDSGNSVHEGSANSTCALVAAGAEADPVENGPNHLKAHYQRQESPTVLEYEKRLQQDGNGARGQPDGSDLLAMDPFLEHDLNFRSAFRDHRPARGPTVKNGTKLRPRRGGPSVVRKNPDSQQSPLAEDSMTQDPREKLANQEEFPPNANSEESEGPSRSKRQSDGRQQQDQPSLKEWEEQARNAGGDGL